MKKNHFLEQARLYGLIGLITLIAALIFYIAVLNSYPLTNRGKLYKDNLCFPFYTCNLLLSKILNSFYFKNFSKKVRFFTPVPSRLFDWESFYYLYNVIYIVHTHFLQSLKLILVHLF